MGSEIDNVELPKLPENQKSFAGIPEAVFVVSFIEHNLILFKLGARRLPRTEYNFVNNKNPRNSANNQKKYFASHYLTQQFFIYVYINLLFISFFMRYLFCI